MTTSKRHHYIPQFLIKNFCDEDNAVWVFDKTTNRIAKNKQSPKSIFFESGRNLFSINGSTVDNIEKMYCDLDSLLAKNLKKVLSNQTMTGSELTLTIFLASLQKWRIPIADDNFNKIVDDVLLEDLGIEIRHVTSSEKVDHKVKKRLNEMDIVKETKRLLLSVQPLLNDQNLQNIHDSCFIVSYDKFPGLLGDCALIEEPNASYDTLENFIFPLSSRHTLICKREAQKYISNPMFYLQKDLNIFHLSEKYVVCKSREHLENTAKIYEKIKVEDKIDSFTHHAFDLIK